MNNKALVRISNTIGVISILLLIYWVFVFIIIQVFGLKIFRENLTQTFSLSVLGILALMSGALIINVMFNLTRIAEKHNQDSVLPIKKSSKKIGLLFTTSFPIIAILLFGGNYLTSQKKEKMLIQSAKSILENNKETAKKLVNYSFNEKWIIETDEILDLYSKTDSHFPFVTVITKDTLNKSQIYLGFRDYYRRKGDTLSLVKKDFIHKTTNEEREYLNKVFIHNFKEVRFSANDGSYELFYPYSKDGKTIVLYFSDYQHYGKLGS
jgi:hypothetical protein